MARVPKSNSKSPATVCKVALRSMRGVQLPVAVVVPRAMEYYMGKNSCCTHYEQVVAVVASVEQATAALVCLVWLRNCIKLFRFECVSAEVFCYRVHSFFFTANHMAIMDSQQVTRHPNKKSSTNWPIVKDVAPCRNAGNPPRSLDDLPKKTTGTQRSRRQRCEPDSIRPEAFATAIRGVELFVGKTMHWPADLYVGHGAIGDVQISAALRCIAAVIGEMRQIDGEGKTHCLYLACST